MTGNRSCTATIRHEAGDVDEAGDVGISRGGLAQWMRAR